MAIKVTAKAKGATKKAMRKAPAKKTPPKKPYVFRDTIWKRVGGALSSSGESRRTKVGKYDVCVERARKLDKYGNPVHFATVVTPEGKIGYCTTNGSATTAVSNALKDVGVEVRYKSTSVKKGGKK